MAPKRREPEPSSDDEAALGDEATLDEAMEALARRQRKRKRRPPVSLDVEHWEVMQPAKATAHKLRSETNADKETKKQENCSNIGKGGRWPWSIESYKPSVTMLKAECQKRDPTCKPKRWSRERCMTFLEKNTAIVVADPPALRRASRESHGAADEARDSRRLSRESQGTADEARDLRRLSRESHGAADDARPLRRLSCESHGAADDAVDAVQTTVQPLHLTAPSPRRAAQPRALSTPRVLGSSVSQTKPRRWQTKDVFRLVHAIAETRVEFLDRGRKWDRQKKDSKAVQAAKDYWTILGVTFQDKEFLPGLDDLSSEFDAAGIGELYRLVKDYGPAVEPFYEVAGAGVKDLGAKLEGEYKKLRQTIAHCTAKFKKSGGGEDDDDRMSANNKGKFVVNNGVTLYMWLFLGKWDLPAFFQSDIADKRAHASGETPSSCSKPAQPRETSGSKNGGNSDMAAAFATPFTTPQDESAIMLHQRQAQLAAAQVDQIEAQNGHATFQALLGLKRTFTEEFDDVVHGNSAFLVRRIRLLFVQLGDMAEAEACTAQLVLAGLELPAAAAPRAAARHAPSLQSPSPTASADESDKSIVEVTHRRACAPSAACKRAAQDDYSDDDESWAFSTTASPEGARQRVDMGTDDHADGAGSDTGKSVADEDADGYNHEEANDESDGADSDDQALACLRR
ncbi:hypothetical protein M885DRAFT_562729 [Pelagophyceae sp. CCMP2097]|nr:hypothetical protein M885DRAFT_562729 [Pelagophyceae sp. CCMP2097]